MRRRIRSWQQKIMHYNLVRLFLAYSVIDLIINEALLPVVRKDDKKKKKKPASGIPASEACGCGEVETMVMGHLSS